MSEATTAGKLYRSALRNHWRAYSLGVAALFICSISEVMVPKFIQWSFDLMGGRSIAVPGAVPGEGARATLTRLLLAMLAVLFVGLLGRVGWRQLLARQTHLAGRDLKVRLWQVLRYQPLRTLHRYPLGDLMNRATGDWNAVRAIHGFTLVQTLDLIFYALLSIGCMLAIDWQLTLFCLAILPLLPYWILRLARRERDLHSVAQDKLSELSEVVTQALGTIRLQRATNSDAMWQERLHREARDYSEKRFAVVKTGWQIYPLGALPTLGAYAVLLFYGVHAISRGQLSIGQFIAMQSYVLMLQGPLFDMGDNIAEWQRGFASFGRLVEIFNLHGHASEHPASGLRPAPEAAAALEVRALSFAYPNSEREVLKAVSFTVRPGQKLGIYGPIGAGKSTLLSLFAGLAQAPRGAVWLSGIDLRELDREWLAAHVTMVPQRAFLFAGTVRYNLDLDAHFSDEELWRVLEVVQLKGDVEGFPAGLETWIGEWGINLSGGQKQRLALARTLLRPRDVILFDDCLSAVDAVTEAAILSALSTSLPRATVIWVAHRMSTLQLCDRIFRLEVGRLSAGAGDRDGELKDV